MENYFWNTEEGGRKKQVYVLVIYDIIKNKTRNKFAKVLQGYGFRVQKSAFEAIID
jgi:CRISPR-associated protein Cas2